MANTVTGTILAISKQETMQSKGGREYTKQCVYLDNGHYDQDTGDKYENNLLLEFINYKEGDIAQRFKVGDKVTISFRLRGYSYDSKKTAGKKEYGVSVSCYRIEPKEQQGAQQQAVQQPQAQVTSQAQNFPPQVNAQGVPVNNQGGGGQADDLPF